MFYAIGALTVVFFVIMMVAVHTTPQAPTRKPYDQDTPDSSEVVEYRIHQNGDNNN